MNLIINHNNTLNCAEYLKNILKSPVYKIAKKTPLQRMEKLSERLKNTILVKREDLQIIHSFKLRGAFTMINSLSTKQKSSGVITASAGNHAQGVALSAQKIGIKSTIVMPIYTSNIKIDAVKKFGSKVLLFGDNFDEANKKAIKISKNFRYTFIPPFDHPLIIAGQATLAMELIQQNANIDRIFVPVGGGGLISGIAILIKQLIPQIKIIAVESKHSACLKKAIKAGKPINLKNVDLFAEGVAVKKIGKENFRICSLYIDDIISVSNDAICTAIKDIFEDTRAIAEPSGALSLAGLKKYIKLHNIKNENLAHILSGANFNFHGLRHISECCELGEKKELLLAIDIPEKQGSFLNFLLNLSNYTITEFNYRYSNHKFAKIFIGIRLFSVLDKNKIINTLNIHKYNFINLSKNEIAKSHIRYMIGGKPLKLINEKLYSFVFPESKGSLLNFLQNIGDKWNITLFHYRSYGADYGKVLAGFEIEKNKEKSFNNYLHKLEYEYCDETLNPAFNFFLSKK